MKIVLFGGGTGLSNILSGKKITSLKIQPENLRFPKN
jgi:2-phospho-L-lactate transferase/gluconeogenesis factor (CofD/UPF0052 family)